MPSWHSLQLCSSVAPLLAVAIVQLLASKVFISTLLSIVFHLSCSNKKRKKEKKKGATRSLRDWLCAGEVAMVNTQRVLFSRMHNRRLWILRTDTAIDIDGQKYSLTTSSTNKSQIERTSKERKKWEEEKEAMKEADRDGIFLVFFSTFLIKVELVIIISNCMNNISSAFLH